MSYSTDHRVIWKPCAKPGCKSVNTMGVHCIRHWYEAQGKVCPEPPARLATRRPVNTNTVVPGRTQTSLLAARQAIGRSGSQRVKIYELVKAHSEGLTADDVQRLTGFPTNSVNPRVNELASDGWLIDSGERRLTRYGAPATVWVVAE